MRSCSVLFVCMGNICRSPTAHGVFRHKLLEQGLDGWVQVDSAGTHGYHSGSPADRRAQSHAARRGYDLSDLRARQIVAEDFERHDLILAMDLDNLAALRQACPNRHQHKLHRLTEYGVRLQQPAVPDPYYGGDTFPAAAAATKRVCAVQSRVLPVRHW